MADNYYVRDMKRAASDYIYRFYPFYLSRQGSL